ncbi:hypothetical protein HDZ31DRAFT_62366 [Schizophyllum fasciatum]
MERPHAEGVRAAPIVSSRFFDAAPTSVSSDRTRFCIARATLARAAPRETRRPPRPRSEDARALGLRFRFVQDGLDAHGFPVVARLARAAQEYMVGQHKAHTAETLLPANCIAPCVRGRTSPSPPPGPGPTPTYPQLAVNGAFQEIARRAAGVHVDRELGHHARARISDEPCVQGADEAEAWAWRVREVAHALLAGDGRALLEPATLFTEEMWDSVRGRCRGCAQTMAPWQCNIEDDVRSVAKLSSHP